MGEEFGLPLVHFVHGKESGPWGIKITRLATIAREQGCEVESIDYSAFADAPSRASLLIESCSKAQSPLIIVGSSMGGWVATAASKSVCCKGLFLLAPAFYFPGYPDVDPGCPGGNIEVVHGWNDEVILYEHSLRFCHKYGATLHLVNDDHRLLARLPLIEDYFQRFLARIIS